MQTEEQKLINEAKAKRPKKRIMHSSRTFPNFIKEFSLGFYETKDTYTAVKDPLVFLHKTCGNTFEMTPRAFIGSIVRCPKCDSAITKKRSTDDFKKLVFDLVGDEYSVENEYVNDKEKISFVHNKCGNKFEMIPNSFTNAGHRCHVCSNAKRASQNTYTNEEYFVKVREVDGGEYEPLEAYKGSTEKHLVKHKNCGNTIQIVPQRFFYKDRCPHCSLNNGVSKAMKRMYQFLETRNIKFEREFVDARCKNKRALPFDVAINLKNGKKLLIEYDGEQHFKPCFGGNEENKIKTLQRTKFHDEIKNSFCNVYKQEYELERISYKEEKILENILYNILNKYKLV